MHYNQKHIGITVDGEKLNDMRKIRVRRTNAVKMCKYITFVILICFLIITLISCNEGVNDMEIYSKTQLLKLIQDVSNDKSRVIIGEEMVNGASMVSNTLDRFYKATGQYPGILGLDIRKENIVKLDNAKLDLIITELPEYVKQGGIVTISCHFENPAHQGKNVNWSESGTYRGYLGKEDAWEALITEGTIYNDIFKAELVSCGDFLEKLKENGVPVLWRVFHEMNGSWFWWCVDQNTPDGIYRIDAKAFTAAWSYVYNYLTVERGLDNLLWVYGPNYRASEEQANVTYALPDKGQVDIVGFDWYTKGKNELNNGMTYEELAETGYPVALCEYGPTGDKLAKGNQIQEELYSGIDMLNDLTNMHNEGKSIVYALTWTGNWSVPNMGKGQELMESNMTIGMTEVKAMFDAMN